MLNWLLQKNLTKPETLDKIKEELLRARIPFQEIQVIPFSEQ